MLAPAHSAMAYDVLSALRPAQWTKNLVVLAAFFFASGDRTQTVSMTLAGRVGLAALLFCLVSSGIYLFNDIQDREADRCHPRKRLRPIASGRIPIRSAAMLSGALLTGGLAGAMLLTHRFALALAGYALLQLVYSLWLKHIALVDVLAIALGFVLRAAGGGFAAGVVISHWLLWCAFLLALFLALCKRRHERLFIQGAPANHRRSLQSYSPRLLDLLIAAVSTATVLSYGAYTVAADTVHRFGTPLLALTIPWVVLGVGRYLHLVYGKEEGDRPERSLLTDGPLLLILVLYGLTVQAVFLWRSCGL